METEAENRKPFKIKDVTRNIRKAIVAATLEEVKTKSAERFGKTDSLPTIHLDADGTEVDDEEYFHTLEPNTELIAVFSGERWVDPAQFLANHHQQLLVTTMKNQQDTTDAVATAAAETDRIKKLVGQIQNSLCNASLIGDPDLDSLSNMDPNCLLDITGKDHMLDQLKDTTGRAMCAKREAEDRIDLLKLLIDGTRSTKTTSMSSELEESSISTTTSTISSSTTTSTVHSSTNANYESLKLDENKNI